MDFGIAESVCSRRPHLAHSLPVSQVSQIDLLKLENRRLCMTTLSKALIALSFTGVLSYAENLNGKLLDVSCYDTSQPAASSAPAASQSTDKKSRENLAKTCAPTTSTTNFAFLNSKGKVYRLDSDGNMKAAAAL